MSDRDGVILFPVHFFCSGQTSLLPLPTRDKNS